mgnify:CR=1 FL=1
MSYSLDEQETHIWYEPKTKETVIETNYAPDINHYLRIISEGGMELVDQEIEDDRIISIRAKVNDQQYSFSRKLKKKRILSDEERERLRQQLAKART